MLDLLYWMYLSAKPFKETSIAHRWYRGYLPRLFQRLEWQQRVGEDFTPKYDSKALDPSFDIELSSTEPLLSPQSIVTSTSTAPTAPPQGIMGKALGNFRAVYLVCICCMGSFLFAYDTGIVGGILTLKSFQEDFGFSHTSKADQTQINSNAVSVLQAGAFFGCFIIWPIAARFGRRWSLVVASVVFEIGAIFQIVKSGSLALFYVGRVISGLGVGAATVLIPIYASEMSPKEIRGRLGSFFQLFFAAGVCVSYWVDYGVEANIPPSTRQWQIPLALQLIPGAIVGLGMLLIEESARWLAKRCRNEEALRSLIWVRGGEETPEVKAEFAEIVAGIEEEVRATEGVTWRELMLPANRLRLFIAVSLQLCQQLTGNTSLAYYAPQIFATIAGSSSTQTNLLITGFFGIIKLGSVFLFQMFLVERIGRKGAFMGGAAAMGICMLVIACIVATHPPNPNVVTITGTGIAAIVFVYLEAASYNFSWGPVAWVYIGEIFPSRIREIGVASGSGSQWLFNFMMSQVTPHAIANIGWRTFLMFAIFNFAIIGYSWWLLRETTGKSLEEMETVFGSAETAFDVEATRRKALLNDRSNMPGTSASADDSAAAESSTGGASSSKADTKAVEEENVLG